MWSLHLLTSFFRLVGKVHFYPICENAMKSQEEEKKRKEPSRHLQGYEMYRASRDTYISKLKNISFSLMTAEVKAANGREAGFLWDSNGTKLGLRAANVTRDFWARNSALGWESRRIRKLTGRRKGLRAMLAFLLSSFVRAFILSLTGYVTSFPSVRIKILSTDFKCSLQRGFVHLVFVTRWTCCIFVKA